MRNGVRIPGIEYWLSTRSVLAAALCVFQTFSVEAQTLGPHYFGFTADPTPIVIGLKDRDETAYFKIPKNLLTFSANWEGGVQDFLVIEMIYPSMSALSLNGRSLNRPDALVVHLDSYARQGGSGYSTQRRIDRAISEGRWMPDGETSDENGRSYRHYFEKSASKAMPDDSPFLKEYFVPQESAIHLECFRGRTLPNAGCSAVSDYGKNLELTIQFRRTQFEHWPEFREAVIRLLDSSRQTSTETK